jgi:hypothetical protein
MREHWYQMLAWAEIEDEFEVEFEDDLGGLEEGDQGKKTPETIFLNPWDPGEAPEGGGPPFAVTREELDELFGTDFDLIEEWTPRTTYPEREGREIVRLLRKRANGG